MEHKYEELFVLRDGEYIYSGVDRCRTCKAIRITTDIPYFYLRAGWSSTREPPCHD